MRVSLSELVRQAWDHMVRVLFTPFDLGKWLTLGFAAWLAGLTGSSNTGGGGGNGFPPRTSIDLNSDFDGEGLVRRLSEGWDYLLGNIFILTMVVIVFLAVVLLLALLTWLSSRGKFIFLDGVLRNEAAIKEPWRRFERLGDSLFLFRLAFGLIQLVIVLVVFGGFAWLLVASFGYSEGPTFSAFPILVGLVGFILVYGLIAAAIYFALDAFVIPIMYRLDLEVMDAWRYFLPLANAHAGSFILCALWLLLLWFLVGLGILVVCLFTCCIAALLLALPYIGTVLMLPLLVTYRSFTVLFLYQIDPSLAAGEPTTLALLAPLSSDSHRPRG